MRVLLISHTCQSRTEGQPKAECLAQIPDLDLRVLVPDRWLHYGAWRGPQVPEGARYAFQVGRVRWPWVGPAQFYLHWYPELAKTLREFQPDVIDLWEEPWGLVSAHACRLRNKLLPSARIVSETEQNIDKTLPFPFEALRAFTLRNADYAIGRSEEAVRVLRAKGYAGPAEAVPNAVDAELFRPLERSACRSEVGTAGFAAGYVGRLVEEKGILDMIDALDHCPPHVNMVFVGSGPLAAEVERRMAQPRLAGRIKLIPASPLEALPRIMNALDVLVLPSRTTARWKEQFGRVIIEANACGIPVVGSDSGAIPDVVGQGGVIVPEGDPRRLGAALTELATNPKRVAELGRNGRSQVEAMYTWQRVAQRMHLVYERVIDEPRRTGSR